jgi:hypothetical protein
MRLDAFAKTRTLYFTKTERAVRYPQKWGPDDPSKNEWFRNVADVRSRTVHSDSASRSRQNQLAAASLVSLRRPHHVMQIVTSSPRSSGHHDDERRTVGGRGTRPLAVTCKARGGKIYKCKSQE